MKVFVAGATGVLGKRAVRKLVEAGHDVTGLVRSVEKGVQVEAAGARAAILDLFDLSAVKDAVVGHDAVLNLATSIPRMSRAALPGAWADNDRIRTEGAHNLVEAALATGAGRYVQESITFLYDDQADRWIDEESSRRPVPYVRSVLSAEEEAARFTAAGGAGVVLRFGFFYGPDSHHSVDTVRMARRRIAMIVGAPDAYASSIHTDDAAAAVVAALDMPPGVYNVVDDEPLTRREFGVAVAEALGVKPPRAVPRRLVRMVGGSKSELLMRSQRVSNQRFRTATDWAPLYPSAKDGWPAVVAEMGDSDV